MWPENGLNSVIGVGMSEKRMTLDQTIAYASSMFKRNKQDVTIAEGHFPTEVVHTFDTFFADTERDPDKPKLLAPPLDLKVLIHLSEHNNTLAPCIETMEVNVDGTGYDVVFDETVAGFDKGRVDAAVAFFKEPYPGRSFVSLRRENRRMLEQTGNSYFVVMRTLAGKIAFMDVLSAVRVRLVKLDEPVPVKVERVIGDSVEVLTLMKRERRYAKISEDGKSLTYYREFGSSRHLDRNTGKWDGPGSKVAVKDRADELIHNTVHATVNSPYGVPRWIAQSPSVVGSRQAEELNLEYFNSGGLPPFIMFLSGGMIESEVKTMIDAYLDGKAKHVRNRVLVVPVISSGGSLDAPTKPDIKIERFGSEQVKDSMFDNYDDKTGQNIRGAFRFSELFVGKSGKFNFATAFASYTVAENQVFEPERTESDEAFNLTVMKEFGPGIRIKSRPLSITDGSLKLRGIQVIGNKLDFEPGHLVDEVNDAVGTTFSADKIVEMDEGQASEERNTRMADAKAIPVDPPATARSSDRQ